VRINVDYENEQFCKLNCLLSSNTVLLQWC